MVLSFTVCLAQTTNLKKADALFRNYSYADASKAYEEILANIKSPSAQTLKNAADSYYFISDERNHASRTAIEKIGGQLEGVLRSHTVLPDGFRRNTVYYSILKDEWNNMKSAFISTH